MASLPEPLLVILAPPPPFLLVPGKPSLPWPKWLKSFKNYIQALGDNKLSDSSKCALLQNFLGAEGQLVFTALIPKESTFSAVISALTTYFSSKHTLDSCCLHFRHRAQKPGESASQFVAALKDQTKLCNNEHLQNLLILDQLIEKTNCPRLRERLLLERDTLSLEQALSISKELEFDSYKIHPLAVSDDCVNVPEHSDPPVRKKASRGRPRRGDESANLNKRHLLAVCDDGVDVLNDSDSPVRKKAQRGRPRRGEEGAKKATNQPTDIPARPHQFRDDYFDANDKQYYNDEHLQSKTITAKSSPDCDPANEAVIDTGTMTASPQNTEPGNFGIPPVDEAAFDEWHDDNECEGYESFSATPQKGFCEICAKDFKKASRLNRHMRTHTKEKPFSCHQCNSTFSQSYHMTRHMRNLHGADCYVCSVCGESFGCDSELHHHKKSHKSKVPSRNAGFHERKKLKSQMVPHGRDNTVLAQAGEEDHQEIHNSCTRDVENERSHIWDLGSHASPVDAGCKTSAQANGDTSQNGQAPGVQISKAPLQAKMNHTCPICVGRHFRSASKLTRHMTTHTKERAYRCPVCARTFTQSYHMNQHLKDKHKQSQYNCPKCLKSFSTWLEVRAHKRTHSVNGLGTYKQFQEKSYSCQTCGKTFKMEYAYRNHVRGHQNQQSYHCSVCQKYFLKLSIYMSHIKVHSTRESKCPHCKVIFPTAKAFKYHLRTHVEERPHQCDCCIETFEDQKELELHCLKHRKFRKQRPYSCSRCDYAFGTMAELREHMGSHQGEEPISCPICSQTFLNKNKLEKHQLLHSGMRPHLCTVCGSSFSSASNLRLHCLVHTGEKPYKCRQCDKAYGTPSGLRLHSRQHMEVRPSFKCHECGRTYGRLTELKMHQRNHAGDRPYVCTCCNKRFVRKDKLKVHMRTHTGERPYQCVHCEQTFTQSGDRNRHIAKFHSDAVGTQDQ